MHEGYPGRDLKDVLQWHRVIAAKRLSRIPGSTRLVGGHDDGIDAIVKRMIIRLLLRRGKKPYPRGYH